MEMAAAFVSSVFTGGGAAATGAAATAATTGAATAASGFSLSSLLQGTATVFGMMNAVAAGNADAEAATLAADDAAREVPLETLKGINRRSGIKQAMMDRIGEQDVAYAASGVDLSFGTPGQARKDAFREADYGLTVENGNEQTNVARLQEREANYRKRAKRARMSGWADAAFMGLNTASSIAGRG